MAVLVTKVVKTTVSYTSQDHPLCELETHQQWNISSLSETHQDRYKVTQVQPQHPSLHTMLATGLPTVI